MEKEEIEFEGGGVLKLEELNDGINIVFQSPHYGEQFKIVSMNVVLTKEEGLRILAWLSKSLKE